MPIDMCVIPIQSADSFQCCVTGGTTPPATGAGTAGLDLSGTPAASFWSCAAADHKVVAIEGYIQACAVVSDHFLEVN